MACPNEFGHADCLNCAAATRWPAPWGRRAR